MFFIRNEIINSNDAMYPTHSVKEISKILNLLLVAKLGFNCELKEGRYFFLEQSLQSFISYSNFFIIKIQFVLQKRGINTPEINFVF